MILSRVWQGSGAHQCSAGATQHVGPGSLEEGLGTLIPHDLAPGVHSAGVVPLTTRLCSIRTSKFSLQTLGHRVALVIEQL